MVLALKQHATTSTQPVACTYVCPFTCLQAAMGVHMLSDTGDVLFDVQALYPLLMQR